MNQKLTLGVAALSLCALTVAPLVTSSAQAKDHGKMHAMGTMQKKNVAQVAMGAPQFSTLVTAVKAAGLAPALMNTKNITVFAPTNAAFAKLPKATLTMLLKPENKATLASILKYHVLTMKAPASTVVKLRSGTKIKTLNGESFALLKNSSGIYLNAGNGGRAKVITTDIMASNGVIHAIDTVILPPSVVRAMAMKSKMSSKMSNKM